LRGIGKRHRGIEVRARHGAERQDQRDQCRTGLRVCSPGVQRPRSRRQAGRP
jgi:hypothetical protein